MRPGIVRAAARPAIATIAAVAATFVLPTVAAPQAASDFSRGGEVERACTAGRPGLAAACDAYLRGMYEGILAGQLSASELTSFCPPQQGVGADDIRRAFLAYMDEDPESRSEDAGMILLGALEDAYPCTREADDPAIGPLDDPGRAT